MDGTETSPTSKTGTWIAISGAAGLVILGVFFLQRPPPVVPVVETPPPAVAVETSPPPAPSMPATDTADAQARRYLSGLSSSLIYAGWLGEGDLARRFVATVNMVADGRLPTATLAFAAPRGRFTVKKSQGRSFIEPSSFARYDELASVISSLDASGAATAYTKLHPLFDAAYKEIGRPGTTLDGRLADAIEKLVNTSVPSEPLEVVEVVAGYHFADPKLEGLSPASKQLLRMGPHNMKLLQDKLREVAADLHLSPVTVKESQ